MKSKAVSIIDHGMLVEESGLSATRIQVCGDLANQKLAFSGTLSRVRGVPAINYT
jgi:hypothetical protein